MATTPTQGYYGFENGQYIPLSSPTTGNPFYGSGANGSTAGSGYYDTTGNNGDSSGANSYLNPNSSFYTSSNGAYSPYTGSVYNVGSSGAYNLFSSGSSTPTNSTSNNSGSTSTGTGNTGTTATTPAASTSAGTPEGTLSNVPGALPGTSLSAADMTSIQQQNAQNATNPTLSASETATPVNQQVQPGETLSDQTINANADQVDTSAGNISASTVGSTATAAGAPNIQAATYQATTIDPNTVKNLTQAVTASLPANALVSNQLQSLLTPDANGNLPAWISPAVTAANQLLAGRGISNSSMAGQAIMSAILTAAIPVATSNANAELTAFTQNLSNEQQAAMQNGQDQVNVMLSNQGAENAASNFNATSTNQTNQFLGSLAAQINQFNAAQTNAISQFNASQTQTAATNSAQLTAQLAQFNANMANQREQFNVQNAIIVQQSNAEYLRAVNTANTAVANQDNQLNAQNAMNLSDTAMANLQTQFNDEQTMLYNSNMTAEQQNYSIAYLSQQYGLQNALDQNITDMQENQALNVQIGTLAGSLFNPIAGAAGSGLVSGISSLFGSSSNNNSGGNSNALDPGNTGTNISNGDGGTETGPPVDVTQDNSGDEGDIGSIFD